MAPSETLSYTAGPWVIQGARASDTTWAVGRKGSGSVAFVRSMENATLIAAAPDLYALAEQVAAHFADTDAPLGELARALLAKVGGR